jgi:hypothetical protein
MNAYDYSMRHITRLNYKKISNGWLVRLYATHPEYYVYDYFFDKDFGSKESALMEAKQYRNWLERTWPKPPNYSWHGRPHGYEEGCRVNNKSGKTGVHYSEYETIKTHRVKNKVYRYKGIVKEWRATWRVNGINRIKRFSASKYGFSEAKEMAVNWRKKVELLMQNESNQIRNPPC